MSKGSMSMGAVVLLVVGIVAAALIVGGILSPSTDKYRNASASGADNASNWTSYGSCVGECREKHPGDRGAFLSCRESRGCPPR
ncbi:MAG: hypothetical protein ABEK10_02955 [Candidatus Nanosalina sp.]